MPNVPVPAACHDDEPSKLLSNATPSADCDPMYSYIEFVAAGNDTFLAVQTPIAIVEFVASGNACPPGDTGPQIIASSIGQLNYLAPTVPHHL